jgi:hypothetical protein
MHLMGYNISNHLCTAEGKYNRVLDRREDQKIHFNFYFLNMKTLSFYILNVLPSLTAGSWSSDYWIPGKLVKTQSGLVQGRLASEFTQVSAYLGIPYAKPPLDDLRFEVPEKFEGHSVVDGTKFVRLSKLT